MAFFRRRGSQLVKVANAIITLLNIILENQGKIMTGLTDLQNNLTALTAAVNSLVTYLNGLPAAILALQGSSDPDAAVEALSQQVATQTAALTAGLTAAPTLANIQAGTITPPPAPPAPPTTTTTTPPAST